MKCYLVFTTSPGGYDLMIYNVFSTREAAEGHAGKFKEDRDGARVFEAEMLENAEDAGKDPLGWDLCRTDPWH